MDPRLESRRRDRVLVDARPVARPRRGLAAWIVVVVAAWLCAPACSKPDRERELPVEAQSSRVDVFLRAVDAASTPLGFSWTAIELVDGSGAPRALASPRRAVSAAEAASRLPIAGAIVPPGHYVRLRISIDAAWIEREGERRALALEPVGGLEVPGLPENSGVPESTGVGGGIEVPRAEVGARSACVYELPLDLSLSSRDAASIFVDWRAADSLRGGLSFAPLFALSLERPQTSLGMLYVASSSTGSVLAIDRASGQVVGSHKSGAEPAALALLRDRRRLCVANAGDGSLVVLDVRSGRIEATMPIGFSARTSDVLVADDDRVAVCANPDQDSVSFLTLAPGGALQNVGVDRTPTRLAWSARLGRVFVCQSGADSVSAIDLGSRAVVARAAVESAPSAVEVDRDGLEVFVGHRLSPNLLALDARTLARNATIFVGGNVSDVLADPRRSRVYVARGAPDELLIVERRVGAVVRRIPLSAAVERLALSIDGGRLYGASPESGSLLVIDLVLGREGAPIRLGSRPRDVVVAD